MSENEFDLQSEPDEEMPFLKKYLLLAGIPICILCSYLVESFTDSSGWRIVSFVFCLAYLYLLMEVKLIRNFVLKISKYDSDGKLQHLIFLIFSIALLMLSTSITEYYNSSLLEKENKEIEALVCNCSDSNLYCSYEYTINGKNYKKRFHNYLTKKINSNTIKIIYYPPNPRISKIK